MVVGGQNWWRSKHGHKVFTDHIQLRRLSLHDFSKSWNLDFFCLHWIFNFWIFDLLIRKVQPEQICTCEGSCWWMGSPGSVFLVEGVPPVVWSRITSAFQLDPPTHPTPDWDQPSCPLSFNPINHTPALLEFWWWLNSGISTSITHARLPDVSQDTYVTKSLRGRTRHP